MGKRFLGRISPATIIASIALFVSLGGVSYGVATGSIDSREIKNNNVAGKDIKTSTLRGSDVGANSLTGLDIQESSLGTVPSATNAGRASTAGSATSAASAGNAAALGGSPAADYPKDLTVSPTGTILVLTNSTSPKTSERPCPEGTQVVSGGYLVGGAGANDVVVTENRPTLDRTGWVVEAHEIGGGTAETWSLTTRVVCSTG